MLKYNQLKKKYDATTNENVNILDKDIDQKK